MIKMMYGYARCSTNEDRQDIERQKRELRALGVDNKNIYFEYESGSKENRIELDRLLDIVKEGDTIVTTEVSRLTRSTKQLCNIIELAKEKQLEIIIGTFRVDCRHGLDPMTDGMLKMMGVFAEMERNMISQRITSGLKNAKAKGVKLGRPTTTIENIPSDYHKYINMYLRNKNTPNKIAQEELALLCKCSRPTISKYVKIFEDANKKADEEKFKTYEKKEFTKEAKRRNGYKYMSHDELQDLALEEEGEVFHNGISEFTPATKELERRAKKYRERLNVENESNKLEVVVSGFDEFDI